VNYCTFYLQHADELWRKSLVEDRDRLQTLMFPSGLPYDSLDVREPQSFRLCIRR
jgi:hypothetical protein